MSVADVRAALAAAVDTIPNLRATAYLTDEANTNQAMVRRGPIEYDLVMGRGADTWDYRVVVYAPRSTERESQKFLDTLCEPSGSTSLKTVVEADAALAALVDYVKVTRAGEVQEASSDKGTQYLVVEFELEIVY